MTDELFYTVKYDENHAIHPCVDALSYSIISAAQEIHRLWKYNNLACLAIAPVLERIDSDIHTLHQAIAEELSRK